MRRSSKGEKSKKHTVMVIGKPVCEIPPSRSIIKNAHSQGGEIGEVGDWSHG